MRFNPPHIQNLSLSSFSDDLAILILVNPALILLTITLLIWTNILQVDDYLISIAAIANIIAVIIATYTLKVAISQWREAEFSKKRAVVNAIFEELRNNLKGRESFVAKDRSSYIDMVKPVYSELNTTDRYHKYLEDQNNIDSVLSERFTASPNMIDFSGAEVFVIQPLKYSMIENAINSGWVANLLSDRIFLNVNSILSRLQKDARLVHNCNEIMKKTPTQANFIDIYNFYRDEYLHRIHLYLYLLMIDMVENIEKKYFIDKNFVREIQNSLRQL